MKEGIWKPLVDIYETADSIVIKAELPGVDQNDIDVLIEENTLILKGERRHDGEVKRDNYHRTECYFGTFQCSLSLPTAIDQENVAANCEKGVLTITLPKKEKTKPKQIYITVKQA